MPHATVDIIIPARNEALNLEACLSSLCGQTYPLEAYQIWLVDHASTDATRTIALEVSGRKTGITIHVLEASPRLTLGAIRNLALKQGTADFVAFLDAHCVVPATWLAAMVADIQQQRPSGLMIGGVQGPLRYVCKDAQVESVVTQLYYDADDPVLLLHQSLDSRLHPMPWIPTGNVIYRRDLLEAIGGFNECYERCEDVDLSWRVFLSGYGLVSSTQPQLCEVRHQESCSRLALLKKHWAYGWGARYLVVDYQLKGLQPMGFGGFCKHPLACEQWAYHLGYWMAAFASWGRQPCTPLSVALLGKRPWMSWDGDREIRLSSQLLYWQTHRNVGCRLQTQSEWVVFSGAGVCFWNGVLNGLTADSLIDRILLTTEVSRQQLISDLYEWFGQMVQAQLIECRYDQCPKSDQDGTISVH